MNSIASWIKIHSLAFRQFIEDPSISVMNNSLDSQHFPVCVFLFDTNPIFLGEVIYV